MYGGDVVFCQITLSTWYHSDYLRYLKIKLDVACKYHIMVTELNIGVAFFDCTIQT